MWDDEVIVRTRSAPAASSAGGDVRIAMPHVRLVHSASSLDIRLEVHGDLGKVEAEWRAFERNARCTVFQTFDWLAKWQRHIGTPKGVRPAIVLGRNADGELLFIFPLAVEKRGMFRCLTWLGSELCDYNAPLLSERFVGQADAGRFAHIWRDVMKLIRKKSVGRFDFVDLGKMPETVGGEANPFLALKVQDHPSGAHLAGLGGDWETFYAAKRSPATRKKERKRLKQFGEFGELRFVDAQDEIGRTSVVRELIAQKSHWFARMGVRDIFSKPGHREFFTDVATDPKMSEIVHVSRLDVGSTAAATSMGLRFGGSYCLVLSSYLDSELSRFGPGRIHLHELLRYAMGKGFRWFDFTVGDEPYKRDWSDKEVKLYDHLAAVTVLGRLVVISTMAFRRTKRFIKRTPLLWRAYGTLRSLKGRLSPGPRAVTETE